MRPLPRSIVLALALALFSAAPRAARAEEDPLAAAVAKFLAAEPGAEREGAAEKIVALAPDPTKVSVLLAEGRAYGKDVETGWSKRKQKCSDGKERPYALHVPAAYDPANRRPMLFDLHGGVSRPKVLSDEQLDGMKEMWGGEALAKEWFLAIPTGQTGAEWWTEVGASNVLGILAAVKREYAIAENRVFVTGFSDGGSGAYWLALTHPTPFAGMIPLNGHVGVAAAGGLQVHLRNLLNRPIYAVNTDQDSLYPSAGIRPVAEALKDLGAPFTWREVTGYGHDPSYLPEEKPAILTWMDGVTRVPQPERVAWEGTDGARCRVHGLADVRISPGRGGATLADPNPLLPPGRVRLGIEADNAYEGPGVRVKAVSDGTPAASLGLAAGDVVVALDGKEIATLRDLRTFLSAKKPGDAFKVKVRRGEETIEKDGAFPAAQAEPAFDRKAPSGAIEVRRKGNAYEVACRDVASFDLWLEAGAIDLSRPVVVTVNGTEAYRGTVAPDLKFLLARAAEDDDRATLYLAKITVAVLAPKEPR